MKYFVIRYNTGNDACGNPARVFVVYETATGEIKATYDEGYYGAGAITNRHHKAAWYRTQNHVETTKREYRDFVKLGDKLRSQS